MIKSVQIGCRLLLLAGLLVGASSMAVRAEPTGGEPLPENPPIPTVVRFDPAAIPEIAAPLPPLGWRYSALSQQQTKALRRGFKLPLDALSTASSTDDLLGAVKIAPLPDPDQPLLSVTQAKLTGKANPFASSGLTSFRDDPMRALGEMLAAVDGVDASAPADASADDPFAGDAAFSPAAEPESGVAAEVETTEASDDPFTTDTDPFGGDEDPFGDF